jgi:hypothetical protein
MIRWILKGLFITLQRQPIQFLMGMALAVFGGLGVATYTAPPADSPFQYPLPYEFIFWCTLACGIPLVIDAWVRAHNYYEKK